MRVPGSNKHRFILAVQDGGRILEEVEAGVSGIDTWSSDGPICPYCGYQNDSLEGELSKSDKIPIDCRKCHRDFLAKVTIVTEYYYESEEMVDD